MKYWSFSCCFSSWCFSCRWRSSSSHMAASRATKHMWAQTRLKKTKNMCMHVCWLPTGVWKPNKKEKLDRQQHIPLNTVSQSSGCHSQNLHTWQAKEASLTSTSSLHADSKIKVHLRLWFLSCLCLAWKWGLRHLNLAQDTWGKLFAFLSCLKQQQS